MADESNQKRQQEELERKIREARQEAEKQRQREEELRRIRERQLNEQRRQDEIVKGKPSGERPTKDD
jgi:hypothetical protein